MPRRDLLAEFIASRPSTPYGTPSDRFPNGRARYPIFQTEPRPLVPSAPDESLLSDRAFRCNPPPLKPLGAAAGVYRYYRADHQLLYVGKSTNPRRRHTEHQNDLHNRWWREVDHLGPIAWFPTVPDALAAETRAMETEHPMYNNDGIWLPHRYDSKGRCPCGARIFSED